MVNRKACSLCPPLHRKTMIAQLGVVRRFVRSNRFAVRTVTRKSTVPPDDLEQSAKEFVTRIRNDYLDGQAHRDPDYILNMDQTPVWSMVIPKKTLDVVGSKSVKIRTLEGSKNCVTVAVTVTASGKLLKEVVVFRSKNTNQG